jgi:hypothetical protein
MVLTPVNLIARLVPLVPRPGTHQLRFHGALAPRSDLRRSIIPHRSTGVVQLQMLNRRGEPTPRAPERPSQEQQAATASEPTPTTEAALAPPAPVEKTAPPPLPLQKLRPMSWPRRRLRRRIRGASPKAMQRLGGHNVEQRPHCGALLRPITVVLDPDEIHRILAQRGIIAPVPLLSVAPARGPPAGQLQLPFPETSRAPCRPPVAA